MTPTKILVTGATGFIGSRLCERLTLHYRLPYRAFVRRFTKANRVARMGAELVGGDLLRPDTIHSALQGCDAVVHLAHSDDESAPRETANLIHACLRAEVRRFVHVSSISVHGPRPGPECAREETATIRRYGEAYSDSKAKVEARVRAAVRGKGLPGVVLRPGVVYGPYSPFVSGVVESARRGEVSLIDGGTAVCNAVYVDDVCDAIHAALTVEKSVGQAFFITGDEIVRWKDFTLEFAGMVENPPRIRDFSSEEVHNYWASKRPTIGSNLRALVRLAASPSFHNELLTVPFLGSTIRRSKQMIARMLSEERKLVLKSRIQSRVAQPSLGQGPAWPDEGKRVRETCQVKFANDLAKCVLGWRPNHTFQQGTRLTKTWLIFARLLSSGGQCTSC